MNLELAHALPFEIFLTPSSTTSTTSKTTSKTTSTGQLYDTLRIIRHPQGADHALKYLRSRSLNELRIMHTRELEKILIGFACLSQDQLHHPQILEVSRAIKALKILAQFELLLTPVDCLADLWRFTASSKQKQILNKDKSSKKQTLNHQAYGQNLVDLIARTSVETLYQLGRVDLLIGGTIHPDPQVRLMVARSGAEPHVLCSLVQDVWPQVRLSAAHGLAKVGGPQSICLVKYAQDSELSIRLTAIEGLGRLTTQSWVQNLQAESKANVHSLLKSIIGNSALRIEERSSALTALARWGSTKEAEQLLKAHFERGGLLELSKAALYAQVITSAKPLDEIKETLQRSPSQVLRGYAALLLTDHRVKWTQGGIEQDAQERLILLKQIYHDLKDLEPRVASRIQLKYQELYQRTHRSHRPDFSSSHSDLAPPLDQEDDD